jgi:Uncharacterized protein conserved in bacteria
MKKIVLFVAALVTLFIFSGISQAAEKKAANPAAKPAVAQPTGPKTIVGVWSYIETDGPYKGKETAQMEVYEKNGVFEGKYVKWSEVLAPKCTECSGERKDKPILGMVFVYGMTKTDDNEYKGKVYDVVKGREAKCVLSLDSPDKLKQKGCIVFLCKTYNWVRVK